MKLRYLILLAVCLWQAMPSFAASPEPLPMLQTASNQMLTALKENKADLHKNPQLVYSLVDKILLPHVDLENMGRKALGRDAWMQANEQQRAEFIKQFSTLLVRTYASALASYQDQTVQFMPTRGAAISQNHVQIDSQIIQDDGPPIPVSYRLALKQNEWKVIDFSVEGVSLVTSFQQQFNEELNQNGMDKLLQKMAVHNQNLDKKNG